MEIDGNRWESHGVRPISGVFSQMSGLGKSVARESKDSKGFMARFKCLSHLRDFTDVAALSMPLAA